MKTPLFIAAVLCLLGVTAHAEVKLPAIFGDHMVLQRDTFTAVWGTAAADEEVKVTAGAVTASTKADASGKWIVRLEKLPLTATGIDVIIAGTNTITLHDVLIGDVWVCGGQSNMALPLSGDSTGSTEVPKADHPDIRLFMVKPSAVWTPAADVKGQWQLCSPASVKGFTAVGYYFGKEIAADEKIPVGLLGDNLGATAAQSWTSLEGLQAEPALEKFVNIVKPLMADPEAAKKAHEDWLANGGQAHKDAVAKRNQEAYTAQQKGLPVPPPAPLYATPEPPFQGDDKITGDSGVPSSLFNGMISPILPFTIKGVIWYQGESGGQPYDIIFPNLITDWRKHWGQGDFPFLFVQLPNFRKPEPDSNGLNGMSMTREAQAGALKLPHTGMAVTIEVGDPNNLHPPYKEPVGHRLALAAKELVYGEKIVGQSPLYESATPDGNKINVKFKNTGTGLKIGQSPVVPPGATALPTTELKGFAVAGADGKYSEATATITAPDTVTVTAEAVANPTTIRYAWNSSPQCNLYNSADLPAGPFRTDTIAPPAPMAPKK